MPNNVAVVAFMSFDGSKDIDPDTVDFAELLKPNLLSRVNPHEEDPGDNWYNANVNQWGTKWDFYEPEIHRINGDGSPIVFTFCTAWSKPNHYTMQLIQKFILDTYPIKDITWQYHEPYDNTIHPFKVKKL